MSHRSLPRGMSEGPAYRRLASGLALGLALVACGGGSRAPASPTVPVVAATQEDALLTPEGSLIGLRKSVAADQYFWLRAKALEGEAPQPFAGALGAMVDLRSELSGDPTAWEDLEVPLGNVQRAKDLSAAYATLPESKSVAGKQVPLRARALRLSHTMEGSEAAFRRGPYLEHDAEIGRAAKELSARLMPKLEEILAAVQRDLGLPGATRPIVVTLVGDAPYPGIFAADVRGQESASFVRVRGLEGGALVETVLHESLHAIDELTVRSPTAMNLLREALAKRGFDDSDSNVEMAINTLTFAEAASLVRRFVDPAHRPLGESGFYALYPPAKAIVDAWTAHVDAGESLDGTADAIAKAVSAP